MATIFERIKTIAVGQLGVDEKEVVPTASFVEDLGADSLDLVELIMSLEEAFSNPSHKIEIPDEDEGRDGWKPIASVVAKPHYFDAVITADPAQLILMDDDDLDSKACHEVMHIVLSPYHEWGETMLATMDKKEVLGYREYELVSNERVTSRLAQIVRKLFKNSKDGPCCHKHEPKQRIPKAKKS